MAYYKKRYAGNPIYLRNNHTNYEGEDIVPNTKEGREEMQLKDFETKTAFIPKKSPAAEGYYVVALDIGYSSVKGFSPNSVFVFPSFAREFRGEILSIGKTDERDILYRDENGVTWNVGYAAQASLSRDDVNDSSDTLYNRNRYSAPMFKVIARVGIAMGLISEEGKGVGNNKLIIQTGLPPAYIKGDAKHLKDALAGKHSFQVKVAGGPWQQFDFELTPNDIKVMSQPMGSLLSAAIDSNCRQIPEANRILMSNVLVLDGGFGTVDAFTIRRKRVDASPQSFDNLGMKAVFERTANKIFEKHQEDVKVHLMQQCIQDGYIRVFDRKAFKTTKQPFDDLLFQSNEEVCLEVLEKLRVIYKDLIDYDYLLVTGGTGAAWLDIIKRYFAGLEDLKIISGNQNDDLSHIYSNVRGYYMFQTGQLIEKNRTANKRAVTADHAGLRVTENASKG